MSYAQVGRNYIDYYLQYCDSAIRVATQWYQNHLGGAVRVLLITNDRENRLKAIEEGIYAETSMLDVY